ncbi:MAG: amino acid transporter [Actinobacteria bacterium]|nr:amino acid transporter [Actinomycetota bacterium]
MSHVSAAAAAPHPPTNDLVDTVRDAGVIWFGLFVLGNGFGVLAANQGLQWWLAPLISASVFAGSAEFILAGLLANRAPLATIATTILFINSRHVFYALSFPLERVTGRLARLYSVFAMIDEAYALLATRDPRTLTGRRVLYTQIGLHASWVSGSLVGALAGAAFFSDVKGVEFILTSLFVVLTMDTYRARPDRVALSLAIAASLLAVIVTPERMLLVAMSTFTAALVARSRLERGR